MQEQLRVRDSRRGAAPTKVDGICNLHSDSWRRAAPARIDADVILHRARLRLRECLENRWFDRGEQPC